MTQEELDALISGGTDDIDDNLDDVDLLDKEAKDTSSQSSDARVSADNGWPPPVPTEEHQVVTQLDSVTEDSEKKASEIFDKLELVSDKIANVEDVLGGLSDKLAENIAMFDKLLIKFPNVESFKNAQDNNTLIRDEIDNILATQMDASNEVLDIMDIMQYQDIHRQKIERVVNVMRSLATYMNSLFATNIEDSKRVSSPIHIEGDANTDELSTDDLEELISKLGKK